MSKRTPLPLVACALGGLGVAQEPTAGEGEAAASRTDVGQTIVTARKIEEDLLHVPRSITAVGSDVLRDAGITTIQDASIYVPNLRLTEFSSRRLSFPFVRGVGSGLGEPAVITYIDGVPQFGTGGTNLPLLDVGRVEFQRGAQSTLFGRNALGGVISVVPREPSTTFEHEAGLTAGDHALWALDYRASGPIGDSGALFSVAGRGERRDGYTTNDFTGNDVDDRQSFFGRGQVLFTPSDDSQVRIGIFGETARDGGFVLSDIGNRPGFPGLRQNPHHINQDFEGEVERDVVSPTVTVDLFGDAVDFKSITAYQWWDAFESSDFDFTSFDLVRRRTEESQSYVYQELRLGSAPDETMEVGEDMGLTWQLGVSGFYSTSDGQSANEFRPFFPGPNPPGVDTSRGDFEDLAGAIYGQSTVEFGEAFDVSLGLRFDVERKEADISRVYAAAGINTSSSQSETFDEFLPSASATVHVQDDLDVYGLAARGFKAGGFNLTAPPGQEIFDPETSWTFEVGVKKSFDGDRHRVSAAGFYIDWDDMQLSQFGPSGGFISNAGRSRSIGAEVEAQAGVAEGLDLFAGFGFMDTEFKEFTDQFMVDVAGNDLPFAPETTWNVGTQYSREALGGRCFARAEFAATGDFFYDAGNREGDSFGLANFRIGYQARNWGVNLWLRNAFDEEYIPVAFQPNPGDPAHFVGENGAPRTLGVSLTAGV